MMVIVYNVLIKKKKWLLTAVIDKLLFWNIILQCDTQVV